MGVVFCVAFAECAVTSQCLTVGCETVRHILLSNPFDYGKD